MKFMVCSTSVSRKTKGRYKIFPARRPSGGYKEFFSP